MEIPRRNAESQPCHLCSSPSLSCPLLHCHHGILLSSVVSGFEPGISYTWQILHLCKPVSQAFNLDSPVPDSWDYRPLPCSSYSFHNRWDIFKRFDFTLCQVLVKGLALLLSASEVIRISPSFLFNLMDTQLFLCNGSNTAD